MKKYKIVFCGELKANNDLLSVKTRLASLFKASGLMIDKLFIGKPVLVRTNLSFNEAQAFKMNFEAAGACCQMLEVSEKPQIPGANLPAASTKTAPVNPSPTPSPSSAQGVSRSSPSSSSTGTPGSQFTYRQPSPPQNKSNALLIIVFVVIIISAFVIFKAASRKSSSAPSSQLTSKSRSSSVSRGLSNNTTTFTDYKGYYTLAIPDGYKVNNKSSGNRSKIIFNYSPNIVLAIIASPMKKQWNPQEEMIVKITAINDGRAGDLSRMKIAGYGLVDFNGLNGYELILRKGNKLAHAYALVSASNTAFSISIVTEGNNYQQDHDILDSAVRRSLQFN
ncbi:MAG: hypothetical protein PVH61_32295 [Candidatus Aminicenantes bacterium]